MSDFHTFTKYTYFQCKSTILYNFDLPRDPSESQHINIIKVFKAFLRTLKSSILIPYEPPRLSEYVGFSHLHEIHIFPMQINNSIQF